MRNITLRFESCWPYKALGAPCHYVATIRRHRELLGRIEKFEFTHLFNARFIEKLSDFRTKVVMTCFDLLH